MKYCTQCNSPVNDNEKFCANCGAPVGQENAAQSFNYTFDGNAIAPGYSDRVNDPEILAAVQKNKKATKIFALILVVAPFIGFSIYSMVSDKMELQQGLVYGAVLSAIFLLCTIVTLLKNRTKNTYEAIVTDKKTRERSDHNQEHTHYYTEYLTYVKTTDGKKKKIVERHAGPLTAYGYLQVGDKFKCHPQFNFPYELYDKSTAPYFICVSCGTQNPTSADRCSKCNIPLLK